MALLKRIVIGFSAGWVDAALFCARPGVGTKVPVNNATKVAIIANRKGREMGKAIGVQELGGSWKYDSESAVMALFCQALTRQKDLNLSALNNE